jgi:hypothetical protein
VQGLTARYELFVRERETLDQQARLNDAAAVLSKTAAAEFLTAAGPAESRFDALLPGWGAQTETALVTAAKAHAHATPDELFGILEPLLIARLDAAAEMARAVPEVTQALLAVAPAREAYTRTMNAILAEKLYRTAMTLDYANVRPSDQPAFHQFKLVWSAPLGARPDVVVRAAEAIPGGTLTVNAGVSWFTPGVDGMNTSRLRDSQVSIGFDWSPSTWGASRPVYTMAYYFQYMHENGVLQFTGDAIVPGGAKIPLSGPARVLRNTKGAIHVAQFRISLPIGNGLRFPAAVSYSNRSELITGRAFWQGHLGVSYDFSALKK